MTRRDFLRGIVAAAALTSFQRTLKAQAHAPLPRAQLVDAEGVPLRAAALDPHEAHIFTYPHRATPNFLVNVGERVEALTIALPGGERYTFPGGVGPQGAIVAYSAICTHAYSFPSARLGVIGYRPPEGERGPRIACCAHLSAFDPLRGAEVVDGPAPHALAAVVLEHNPHDDTLTATGLAGEAPFEPFFSRQREVLREQYRSVPAARELVSEAVTVPAAAFSREIATCPVLR